MVETELSETGTEVSLEPTAPADASGLGATALADASGLAAFPVARAATAEAPSLFRRVGPFVAKVLGVAVTFMAVRSSIADQYLVPTGSMAPTIQPGDRIFVEKCAYDWRMPFTSELVLRRRQPTRGELIVFLDPRDPAITFVKRVIALPGESVMMRDGVLYVDGVAQPLSERQDGQLVESLGAVVHTAGLRDPESYGPVTVPDDEIFVMGDNRLKSYDSRFIGAIPRDLVRGRVIGVVYHYDDTTKAFDNKRTLFGLD